MRRFVACVRLLAVVSPLCLLAPGVARAADAPSDEAQTEERRAAAKVKFQEGAQAYEQGRYKDAVDAFLAADKIAPSAPLSFNVARAYQKLGDGSSALRWYRDYLRRNPSAQNADSVRPIVTALAEELAKKGMQQVSVLSSPAGATVTIDDQPVGVTPWTGEIAPGKHRLLLTNRGYQDATSEFELAASQPSDVIIRLETAVTSSGPTPVRPELVAMTPTPAPSQQSAPEAPHGRRLGVAPYITLGVGALALGGSLTFELLRRGTESDAKHDATQLGYQSKLDTIHGQMVTSRVLLGVGGAFVVAGGIMLLADRGSSAPSGVSVACLPGSCAALAQGRF